MIGQTSWSPILFVELGLMRKFSEIALKYPPDRSSEKIWIYRWDTLSPFLNDLVYPVNPVKFIPQCLCGSAVYYF